jgi:hypothetical protein
MAEQSNRIQFLQDALRKLAKAVREVSGGLIDLDKTISKITGSTKKLEQEVDKASAKTKKYKDNLKEANKEQKKFGKNTDDNNKKSKGFGATMLKNVKTIISFYSGYLLLNGALRLAQTFTVGAVKRFAELESATARVGAVTNATGIELESLRKNTLDVAGATTFTAVEIAGLQTELGKLGFSAAEIQQSTLAIANAAQALGVGLSDIAKKVGVSIRAFNLDASQAASVADTLTSAINGSALSFESFGTSIAYVAPIAGQLGITFQETAAAMGVLADSGFQASRIGTGLRKILLEVGESGESLKETLTSLKGEQLSLNEITEVFGKTAVAQATVLINNIDKLEEYSGKFGELGAATQASAKQIDTLSGKFKLLNSAFDAFLIKLADTSTIGGTVFNNFFKIVLPEAVENQLAAYKQLKDNDFFELISKSSESAAKEVVKNGKNIYKEAEKITRQTLIDRGKISYSDEQILKNGYAISDMTEQGQQAYRGLIEETAKLIRTKKDDLLASAGQERAILKVTEAGQELLKSKKNEIINQKQALEANRLANQEYANLQTQIDASKDSLDKLTKGSDEYKKTVAEIGKLETLQQQIADFQFDDADIQAIVRNLYKSMVNVASTDKEAKAQAKELLNIFTKAVNETLKESKDTPLAAIFSPEQQEYAKILKEQGYEAAQAYLDGLSSVKPELSIIEELSLQGLKSIQELGLILAQEGADMANDIYQDISDERLKQLQNELDAELDLIKNRYETEQDILKSQLDNQLITESQFRQKQKELRQAQVAEENSIERQSFNAEKKQDLNNAKADYLTALAQSFINEVLAKTPFPFNFTNALITSGASAISYAGQVAAINQRQFVPKKFAEGGMVNGPSHSEGGVPFSVQGKGGYEMEGGEFIVNKRASHMHRDLLERINNSYKVRPLQGKHKFATGGLVGIEANESVDYLKAIAEATTSTAIGVSKPVRAYVADKDLRGNATERRIRDRNDRI